MQQHAIGDVIVLTDGRMCGLVTDRDLALRVLADGRDPDSTRLAAVCSRDVTSLAPDDDVDRAVQLVRTQAIRRIPVLDGDIPVGVLSIRDLAMQRDQDSALADVSAEAPNG